MTAPSTSASKLLDVLRLMAQGKSDAQIGRELGISVHGAKRRAQTLYRDLGALDRAHAVAIGYQRGYLLTHTSTCALLQPRVCNCGAQP